MSQTSEAKLTANRENARHSTGPRTEAGKQRTRLNGISHGLTGHTVVMPWEDHDAYDAFVARTIASLSPVSDTELQLATTLADDHWRLNRARAIEGNIFALGQGTVESDTDELPAIRAALDQARTFLNDARQIALLSIYEQRIYRAIKNNTNELNRLQSQRKADRDRAFEEALLLARFAESKGVIYNPAEDPACSGFGFSTLELTRRLHRDNRLAEARILFRQPLKRFRKAA